MAGGGDSSFRRLKAEHLKKRGDQALQDGNYRAAWEAYQQAVELHPDKDILRALYSNCSLAFAKAQRFQDSLHAAEEVIKVSPTWSKGYWRQGNAFLGLQNIPAAVTAFHSAWKHQQNDPECLKKLSHVIQRLTREQLGGAILELFLRLANEGVLHKADIEATSSVAMQEAAFRMISDAHGGSKHSSTGTYYASLLRWMTRGIQPGEAYTVRAAIHNRAKCYLQAREDAKLAIVELLKLGKTVVETSESPIEAEALSLSSKEEVDAALATAYLRLGEAFLAEPNHADRDPIGAFKALTRATEYDALSQELRDRLQEATDELTKEQVERAALEVYNENGAGAAGKFTHGPLRPGERRFQIKAKIAFPQGTNAKLQAGVREALRVGLAAAAGATAAAVTLEGVQPARPPTIPAFIITCHIVLGPHLLQGNSLVKRLTCGDQNELESVIGGADVVAALGHPSTELTQAELEDITPRCVLDSTGKDASSLGSTIQDQSSIVVPSKPKLDLEVPYKMYRLVTSRGTAVERTDKHPFAMSRVYYDSSEKPEEVWVELADGSCRWRQTAGEVRILALKVPEDLSPKLLSVDITPYHLKVSNKQTGEVYLEGRLHRGVVPEDCFWTHCGGEGEDGCCITLQKMNLEVLQRHWSHSESWWTRLFSEHSDIGWDDYEKDYSDLPEEVMARHRVTEAIKDEERQIETNERRRRDVLQEADDLRKRRRQERLNVLRSGSSKDWVRLNRGE